MPIQGWDGAKLEADFAFGSAPFASSCVDFNDRTWTDASTSLRYVHIDRGRSHDLDSFGADAAELTLDNRRRLYDPTCSTNAQAGKVIPGCPVRIRMMVPGTTNWQRIYSGYVESWEVDYPQMVDARLTVKCANGMKYLQLAEVRPDTTGDRIDLMVGNVLDEAGWPSSSGGWPAGATTGWRFLQTALSTGAVQTGNGAPAAEMCRELAEAECGAFWVDVTGVARFVNRHWWADDMKTNSATFSDTGSTSIPYTDLKYETDDFQLYNRVRIKPTRRLAQSTGSTDSIDKYGFRELSVKNVPLAASTDAKTMARWLVQRYKEPGVRLSRLETLPQLSTGGWDACGANISIGNKITVRRHPPGGGVIASTCHVEGKEMAIDVQNGTWTLALNLSPAGLQPSTGY